MRQCLKWDTCVDQRSVLQFKRIADGGLGEKAIFRKFLGKKLF